MITCIVPVPNLAHDLSIFSVQLSRTPNLLLNSEEKTSLPTLHMKNYDFIL